MLVFGNHVSEMARLVTLVHHAVDGLIRSDLGKHSSPGEQGLPEQLDTHRLEGEARADADHGMWVDVERSS